MRRLVLLTLAAAALTSGCSGENDPSQPPPVDTTSDTPPSQDQDAGLRTVSLPYGDGLPYVPAETAAQAICQALTPERWQELLGGPVGRTIERDAECVVTSATATARIRMETAGLDQAHPPEKITTETIGGREARIVVDTTGPVGVVVLPVAEHVAAEPALFGTRPVLSVSVFAEPPGLPDGLAVIRGLFADLLAALVHDGPPVPAPDANRDVAYTPTAPDPDTRFVDLPGPVRGLVVCTALAELNGLAAADLHVDPRGGCVTEVPVWVEVTAYDVYPVEATQFTIAGRPAWETSTGRLAVDLDHGVLELAGENLTHEFAEQLLGKLGEL